MCQDTWKRHGTHFMAACLPKRLGGILLTSVVLCSWMRSLTVGLTGSTVSQTPHLQMLLNGPSQLAWTSQRCEGCLGPSLAWNTCSSIAVSIFQLQLKKIVFSALNRSLSTSISGHVSAIVEKEHGERLRRLSLIGQLCARSSKVPLYHNTGPVLCPACSFSACPLCGRCTCLQQQAEMHLYCMATRLNLHCTGFDRMSQHLQIEAWADEHGSFTRMLGLEASNPTESGTGSHRYRLSHL